MAISKTQSLFFLVFLLFSLKTQARAVRESHFFNKATRDDPNFTEPQTLLDKQEDQIPTPKQEEPTSTTTTPTYQQSQNGYGLYANGYNTPSSTSTEEYNTNDLPSKYSTEEYTQPKTYNNNNNKNSYSTTQLQEKPGMSDTRYLENGRYYYDINSEKNQDKYESTRYNTNLGYKSNSYSSNNNNNYMGYKSNSYSSNNNNNVGYKSNSYSSRSNNNNNNMGYYEPSKRVDSVSRYDNNNNYGSGSYYRSNNENGYEFDGESVNRFRNRQETDDQEDDFEP